MGKYLLEVEFVEEKYEHMTCYRHYIPFLISQKASENPCKPLTTVKTNSETSLLDNFKTSLGIWFGVSVL